MTEIRELENRFGPGCYPMRDLVLTGGRGALIRDDRGREYIDCVAGHGVANVGHAHPAVVESIRDQAGKLITCSATFYTEPRARLLELLSGLMPGELRRGFLCNSGTEAVEAALKMARFVTGKKGIVAAMRGFHGRTLGALSATHAPAYKKPFEPLVPGFAHVPFNNFEKLEAAVNGDTAAVILEVVQGEGGVHIGERAYFQQVRALCSARNILLIIDEIQTGFCRTGKMFAVAYMNIEPDIICLAKGMGGGMPVGAIFFREAYRFAPGLHGSTFGGNPLSCAAALAAIGVMRREGLAIQAYEKGLYLRQKLEEMALPRVRHIRGLGLMIGLELRERVKPHIEALARRGVLALPAGRTVLRLLPPLVISYPQLERVIAALADVLGGERRERAG